MGQLIYKAQGIRTMAFLRFFNLNRTAFTVLIAAGILGLHVATPQKAQADAAKSGVIEILADHAKIHRLPRAAATIIIGNPLIADVSVEGGKLLVITGKSYGTTNLIALDEDGKEIVHFNLYVKTSGIRKLTLQKGTGRVSYTCAPRCERELQVGDAEKAFKELSKAIGTKAGTVKSTSDNAPSD
jgi:Pilus formation protein N terminal region